ncbi:MAG: GNAT family N-acetyltransferase [Alphaproteobacteria bacterium]|nr:GNAT family N-acetyltransferase [Alphaproteobacteria bacterium]
MADFIVTDFIDQADLDILEKGLKDNAVAKSAPPYVARPLAIMRRDGGGAVVAGLTGKTFWDWLYIDILWVAPALRGQGMGRGLVLAAEAEAVERGCHSSYLWTESFEGPDFYPKLGYQSFVVKPDFPRGHQRIGLMKKLV